ncbi:MAG: serine protease [Sandaracinaceae bacterium]
MRTLPRGELAALVIASLFIASSALVPGTRAHAQADEATDDDGTGPAMSSPEGQDDAEGEDVVEEPPDTLEPVRPPPVPPPSPLNGRVAALERRLATSEQCGARARENAARSVVRVRSGNEWAAGFVYHSDRYVVTAFSVISRGQGTTVIAEDGSSHDTLLLARDEELDLAILELREPIEGVGPLPRRDSPAPILGEEVVAIGHPFAAARRALGERGEGLLTWSISQGHIGAINDVGIQADVALTADHSGGPLVDCEGYVLGMITGAGLLSADLGLVARIDRADELIGEAGQPSEFLGSMRLTLGIGAAVILDESGRAAGGGYLTLGAVLFDRISWMNRVGLFTGGIDDPMGDVLEHSRDIVRVETMLGYRFFVDVFGLTTLYIVPELGAMIMNQRASSRRVAVRPGCTPSDTDSCIDIIEENDIGTVARGTPSGSGDEWVVRPAAGLTFLLGGLVEIGYTFELGLETDPIETYHELRGGFVF